MSEERQHGGRNLLNLQKNPHPTTQESSAPVLDALKRLELTSEKTQRPSQSNKDIISKLESISTVLASDDEIHNHYLRGRQVGEGYFGHIFEVRDLRGPEPSESYAMKVQDRLFTRDPSRSREFAFRLYTELLVLKLILPKHPHILTLKEILLGPGKVYLVTELCAPRKDMTAFPQNATNSTAPRAFRQLVEAVKAMHDHGVFHGDLKEENILFADPRFEHLKLIDFGRAEFCPDAAQKVDAGFEPSKWFQPHELQTLQMFEKLKRMDLCMLGNVLFTILAGTKQSRPLSQDAVRRRQTVERPRTELFDEAAMDLLLRIGPEPFQNRGAEWSVTLEEILDHPWLNWTRFGSNPWKAPPPSVEHLRTKLSTLNGDLRELRSLLDEWMIPRLQSIESEEDLNDGYEICKQYRRGGSGVMFEVQNSSEELQEMEILYRNTLEDPETNSSGFPTRDPLRMYTELLILLRILPSNEHIVRVEKVLLNKDFVVVIREPLSGVTLERELEFGGSSRKGVTLLLQVFEQLVRTVRFLHRHGVVHCDLKPHNIVRKNDKKGPTPKPSNPFPWVIAGFDKAQYLEHLAMQAHERFDPRRYFTPNAPEPSADACVQTDVTALGRILHGIMAGRWEPDSSKCSELHPRWGLFDPQTAHLLQKIGPVPFGPPERDRTISVEEICLHECFGKRT